MRFGLQIPHFGPQAAGLPAVDLAVRAEALGFDSVWVGDHIAYPPDLESRFGPAFFEAVTTLTYVAARTRRVTIGSAVMVLPYRNPLVLAKELATLDALSGGRLTVGVGAGWLEAEHAALGVPFKDRGALTDESIRILRTLWTQDRPAFAGRFYRFPPVVAAPRPLQPSGPPIWVGGVSDRALRRAAELGDGWLLIWHRPTGRGHSPDVLRAKIAELQERRARAGRAGHPTIAGVMPLAILDRTPGPGEPLVGAPEAVAEALRRFGEAGLDHVILNPYYGIAPELMPADLEACGRLLERFASEVRPRV